MKNLSSEFKLNPMQCLIMGVGTTGLHCVQNFLAAVQDLNPGQETESGLTSCVVFEQNAKASLNFASLKTNTPLFAIVANMTDSHTLKQLAESGRLWMVPPERHSGVGVAQESLGTGNDPRTGGLLAVIHRQEIKQILASTMRKSRDHSVAREGILDGAPEKQSGAQFTVFLVFSLLGGLGSGAVFRCLDLIEEVKQEVGINCKVIAVALARGNLQPSNFSKSVENQDEALKGLIANLLGWSYCPGSSQSKLERRRPLDSLLVMENRNPHGEISNLDALELNVAQLLV